MDPAASGAFHTLSARPRFRNSWLGGGGQRPCDHGRATGAATKDAEVPEPGTRDHGAYRLDSVQLPNRYARPLGLVAVRLWAGGLAGLPCRPFELLPYATSDQQDINALL